MMSKIHKIGFEIEGEFHPDLLPELGAIGKIVGDGSVRTCSPLPKGHLTGLLPREYNSPAYLLSEIKKIKGFFDKLQEMYDQGKYHYNVSSGFHIHVSFEPQIPPEIFSVQFMKYFAKVLKDKQKQVVELRKDNRYCKITVRESEIVDRHCGERYRFVNLWPSMRKHGTIEFRVFPANEPKRMYRYLIFTLSHLKLFMAMKLKKKFSVSLEAPTTQELFELNANQSTRTQNFTESTHLLTETYV